MSDRQGPLSGRDDCRNPAPGVDPRSDPAHPTPTGGATQSGDDLPEVSGKRAVATLSHGDETGRGPAPLARRRAHPRPPGKPHGTVGIVGAATSGPGGGPESGAGGV